MFVLLRDVKSISLADTLGFDHCCMDKLFDLKLYRLNIDSLKLYGITKIFDNTIPLVKYQFELLEYFPRKSIIKTKKEKGQLYYDMILIMEDYDYHVNYVSVIVDLNKGTTKVGERINVGEWKSVGKPSLVYSNAYHEKNNYKAQMSKDFFKIFNFNNEKDTLDIPVSLFRGNEQVAVDDIKPDSILNRLQFNFITEKDSSYLICSPYTEHEMAVLHGNIYLLNLETQEKITLLEKFVIGYNADLFEFKNSMYAIRTYWDLDIFDKEFKHKLKLKKTQHYEFRY
jgi:hypothetical protein